VLRWALQRGCGVIPKASSLAHQKSNLDLFECRLNEEEMEYLNSLDQGIRICNKFENFLGGYDIFA
jgi:diketogulonate reductase-like aldo/keto reductase